MPLPGLRGSDRVHDPLAQHIGQRPAEAQKQAEREQVHAHIVVLVVGTGRSQVAPLTLAAVVGTDADLPMVVDLIRFSPQLALPFAGLLQKMAPGDACVVGTCEPRPFDRARDWLVDIGNETVGDGHARQNGKVALGDAEGHVGASGVAPLGNKATALQDHAGRVAARNHGADDLAPGAGLVPFHDADVAAIWVIEVARPWAVVGQGEIHHGLQRRWIKAGVGRPRSAPKRTVGFGNIILQDDRHEIAYEPD